MPIPESASPVATPAAQTGAFDPIKYEQLKRYSAAAAEAYKAASQPKAETAATPAPKAGDVGYYSPQTERLMAQAKEDTAAAGDTARDMVAGPRSLKPAPKPDAAPDPGEVYGGYKEIEAAPDPSEVYGGMVEPYKTDSPESVASSAKELAGAKPSQVGEVLDKLKAEEAKGGPDFWDVIQAAAAGWQGQVPLYVQKEIARKEQESELAKTKELLGVQATQAAKERDAEQAFQRQMAREEMENRLKLAGIGSVSGLGGLSLGDLGIGGK